VPNFTKFRAGQHTDRKGHAARNGQFSDVIIEARSENRTDFPRSVQLPDTQVNQSERANKFMARQTIETKLCSFDGNPKDWLSSQTAC
jgi:hypothetical protein